MLGDVLCFRVQVSVTSLKIQNCVQCCLIGSQHPRTMLLKAVTLSYGNVQDVAKHPERRGDRISKTSRLPK